MNLKELFPTTDKYEETFTLRNGCPVGHLKNSLTSGPFGPVSFLDYPLIEKVSHFTKEKIPERNVHALGTGAFGHFTCTNDISKYTCANLFSEIGKKTEILVRFSGTFTEKGDSETIRDPRGFAIKFYTKEGNWDLMTINFPVFPCRDMKVGPDTIHAFKRDPNTFMWNPTLLWDFVANHPEGLHSAMFLYTDRGGTPMTWRHINGFACNTFSFINEQKERFWVKFHLISMQGTKQFDQEQARRISGEEPNFLTKDLKLSIDEKRYPKWKLACQIMPEKEGYENPFTFDCTKVWRHKDYPLIDIGEIELNAWPNSYFTEVEQVAFSPANVVPGISYSPDKLLQGRLLVYDESQYHRIGPNFKQLKVNCPLFRVNNNYVGGNMQLDSSNSFPHYYPSYFGGPKPNPKFMEPSIKEGLGPVDYYDLPGEGSDKDYFEQPRLFWNVLSEKDKQNLCANIGESLTNVTETAISKKIIQILGLVDQTFSKTVESEFNKRSQKEYKKGKYLSEELMSELLKKP